MRVSWRVFSPTLGQFLLGRCRASRNVARKNVPFNKPITKVDTIVIKATSKHPALQREAAESFSALRLRPDVVSALKETGVSCPTVTQLLTIPHILRGKHVLCAGETGSGKTLAYLSPLIHHLRREEEESGVVPRIRRPRALILLPSRNLATQVLAVAKSLCHVARFRAVGLIKGGKKQHIHDALNSPVDIAITTPDALLKFKREEQIKLNDVQYLVVDEADTMFDQSFKDATTSIIKSIKVRSPPSSSSTSSSTTSSAESSPPTGAQVMVVAATLSTQLMKTVRTIIPDIKVVTTKNLHRILPHIEQRFYKVLQTQKADKLLAILRQHPGDVFMVFCNTVSSCDWTAHFIQDSGIPVTKLHAGFRASTRKHLLEPFTEGKTRVLVCTDLASRGIDQNKVTHVVLFDFPHTTVDYLHRVGRTGRASTNTKCRASILLTHRSDVRTAWMFKEAAEKREVIMNQKMSKRLQSNHHQQRHTQQHIMYNNTNVGHTRASAI